MIRGHGARVEHDLQPRPADGVFTDFFRCSDPAFDVNADTSARVEEGYFTFGGAVCFGRPFTGTTAMYMNGTPLPEVPVRVEAGPSGLRLPFDLSEVVTNLRRERYRQPPNRAESLAVASSTRRLYYAVRPLLGIGVRKHLQRLRLSGWERIAFPRWPVDTTVEMLMRLVVTLTVEAVSTRMPFIWFWPDGAEAAVMMTHDVEGPAGLQYCDALMDLDESFCVPSSFQIVPTSRAARTVDAIRGRGFEVNLHDWNHDGRLFLDKQLFLQRAEYINALARELGCRGFRAAVMYREQDWFDALDFDYDMSVPNVAHLDPQRGGCCTVMPYFVGDMVELPLTTIQDYSLLHILGDYSIARWQQQIDLILSEHGLISFIVHPDYVNTARDNNVYRQLLAHLDQLRRTKSLWFASPGDIERWWRQRDRMRLVSTGSGWCVEGCGAERARVAYAVLKGGRVVYEVDADEPRRAGTFA